MLDEIGELPLELQPKLLRVLETGQVRRLGGQSNIQTDVRIIAITHRNLAGLVGQGRFREDLYHRISILQLTVPPLRHRQNDIIPLTRHFLRQRDLQGRATISDGAWAKLLSYRYPGNVRELHNVVARALALSEGDITEQDIRFDGVCQSTHPQSLDPSPHAQDTPREISNADRTRHNDHRPTAGTRYLGFAAGDNWKELDPGSIRKAHLARTPSRGH